MWSRVRPTLTCCPQQIHRLPVCRTLVWATALTDLGAPRRLALDLNMLPHLDFDIRFAQPGPGARSGLALLFGHVPPVHDTIALLVERQDLYWGRLGLGAPCMVNDDGKVVGKPGVSVVEVEHSLCELSKIERFRKGGHCKRDFVPNGSPVTATHPARFVVERES